MPSPRGGPDPAGTFPPVRSVRRTLLLLAYGISLCVQSGDLGSIDTVRRLRVAHSWWTSSPAVAPGEYPGFGVRGRQGSLHATFGPGQSVVMLPADVVGSAVLAAADVAADGPLAEKLRIFFVSLTTFPVLSALAVLAAFELLRAMAFSTREAALGALSLLVATSLLPYTQNNQENSLQLLLTLTGFLGMVRWTGERRPILLVLAGASVGANLLVRVVTAINGVFVVLLGVAQLGDEPSASARPSPRGWRLPRGVHLLAFAGPVAIAVLVERLYHLHRFGSWWGTYVGVHVVERLAREPWRPPGFPFSGDFWEGFLGALFAPARSVLLFDTTIILSLILAVARWNDVPRVVRRFLLAGVGMLLATAAFYAKFYNWTGASAWGARFCTVPSELVGMLAVPLLVRHWDSIRSRAARGALLSLLASAVLVQLMSVSLWYNLEEAQCRSAGAACFVILMRLRNLVAIPLGQIEAGEAISGRMLIPNFFPFIAGRAAPGPAAATLQAVWWVMLAVVVVATALVATRWWRAGRARRLV